MLNVHNLSTSFGGKDLFSEVSYHLNLGDRVGLVGKNGAGKSTMLKILSGEVSFDKGEISKEKGATIGFLKQEFDFVQGRTVLEEAYQAFKEIKLLEEKIEAVNVQLSERTDYESKAYEDLVITLTDITERYELVGGYNYQGAAEKVLLGLGFDCADFDKETHTFSGGWRVRIELAKLLLQDNDILLLDEPTNHLDIESIIWLEKFLRSYTGALVIVSHDKMFLDNVTNRTIEVSMGKIYDFNKPYSEHLKLRNEIREIQLSQQKNQEKQIKQTERLVERFRSKASKASMAQSLIKKLEKMELIEVDEFDNKKMAVSFSVAIQPGKVVLETHDIAKNYDENQILQGVNIIIERGSKIAFLGQNGQGKSTLAKIIVGEINHDGKLKLGHNVKIGYFAQNQADYLDESKTLVETMEDAASETTRSRVRDVLGAFLFGGDDVLKKVGVLSGGERNRLALAKMLLQPFNFLVMDEPTNHLDLQSKNVLKQALQNFQGTLIIISHDRDFLQGLANRVFEFKNKKVNEFPGDINYYLEQRRITNLKSLEKSTSKGKSLKSKDKTKESYKKQKTLSNKISQLESKITQLEQHIKTLETQMNDPDEKQLETYASKQKQLKELTKEWETLYAS